MLGRQSKVDFEITPTMPQLLTLVGMVLSSLSNNNHLATATIIYWVLSLGQALCLMFYIHFVIST